MRKRLMTRSVVAVATIGLLASVAVLANNAFAETNRRACGEVYENTSDTNNGTIVYWGKTSKKDNEACDQIIRKIAAEADLPSPDKGWIKKTEPLRDVTCEALGERIRPTEKYDPCPARQVSPDGSNATIFRDRKGMRSVRLCNTTDAKFDNVVVTSDIEVVMSVTAPNGCRYIDLNFSTTGTLNLTWTGDAGEQKNTCNVPEDLRANTKCNAPAFDKGGGCRLGGWYTPAGFGRNHSGGAVIRQVCLGAPTSAQSVTT